ncbi:hypothetical protein ASPWEDRAFT_385072 [Aspergillus wentii DTO 134E9]|uniref:Uncharacterized protein n=1 Tax=Aspergillus wentii DTO 134E9 TaxID=1073089 RepID=A0A1L9RXM0_ASPWE|nr:uncharacterized protein ASPWEDRAFT_385072 [Aspergillus wentii DTO 134E9]OJJ39624.1 hypothetical protein ASPWEDRAFT_385072 [Aspergillus wentii DTO 134E9]
MATEIRHYQTDSEGGYIGRIKHNWNASQSQMLRLFKWINLQRTRKSAAPRGSIDGMVSVRRMSLEAMSSLREMPLKDSRTGRVSATTIGILRLRSFPWTEAFGAHLGSCFFFFFLVFPFCIYL